uniref:Adhesion G protein-coupled receptor E5 n=1 Tax=Monodelphis domestica TaxID=13616 RepID=A0A5F8HER1_MONDO
MPTLTRCLFLGLCVLVLLETATAQNSKTPRCRPPCPSNAVCINGTQCTCKDGFASGSGKKYFSDVLEICEDINECAPPISISCGMNADCKNTEGSYYCMCIDGYELPTKNRTFLNASFNDCQDIDECQLNSSLCAPYGICIKTHGQYMCKCKSGFAKSIQNEAKECIGKPHLGCSVRARARSSLYGVEGMLPPPRSQTGFSISPPEKAVIGLFSTKKLETLLADAPLALDPEKQRALQQENEDALVGGGIPILLSAVSTAFLSNRDTQNLSSPVTFAFSHEVKPTGPRKEVICAFWEHDNNGSGHWATTGCEKLGSQGNSTTCRCTHLSSFAILMAQYDVEDWKLSVITQVGLGVSLVCLLLCIITFLLCRPIQGSRTTIHLHLCLCLFVGSTVFLVGTANPSQGQAPVGLRCRLVAGLLHYCFLAAFCWMCLEGLELYFLVVRVFPGPALRTRWLCLLGYGTPAVIVAISAAVNSQGYGRPRFCWLSLEKGFIWSFLGPITLIIAFNAFIFVITVWKLTQKFSEIHPDMKKLKKARMLTFTAMAQLCILGCTWIFGLFLFGPHSRVLAYIFTILNCFQGCFLFLLHCLLNKKVREEYRRWACIVTKNKYNEFSTSTTSQSRALRPSLESGM